MEIRMSREEDRLGRGIDKSKSKRNNEEGCRKVPERGTCRRVREVYCEFSMISSVKTLEQFSIPALTFSCSLSLTLGKILYKNRSG
jgi:hypothetical protein